MKDKHEPVTRPQHGKSSFIPKSPPLHLPEHHSVLVTRYIFASLSFFWCHLTKLFVLVQQPTGFYSIWQKHCMILLIMLDMYFLQQHWFSSHEAPFKISIVKKKMQTTFNVHSYFINWLHYAISSSSVRFNAPVIYTYHQIKSFCFPAPRIRLQLHFQVHTPPSADRKRGILHSVRSFPHFDLKQRSHCSGRAPRRQPAEFP